MESGYLENCVWIYAHANDLNQGVILWVIWFLWSCANQKHYLEMV